MLPPYLFIYIEIPLLIAFPFKLESHENLYRINILENLLKKKKENLNSREQRSNKYETSKKKKKKSINIL
jgi:hypothetical protein